MHCYIVFILIPIAIASTGTSAQSDQTSQKEEFSKSITHFAVDFYKKCSEETDDNIIVSPFSVASVLALLIQGTDGDTLKQIQSALHLHGDKETIANQFQEYYRSVGIGSGIEENDSSAFSLANRLYLQQGYQVKPAFKDVIIKKLRFDIESLNFKDADSSARAMNEFVERQTKNKITDLFQPESIDADTRLVAVNAIYFKDDWEKKFDKESTYQGDFFLDETKKIPIDFMSKYDEFRFVNLSDLDASAIELQYKNSGLVFVIVLPNSRTGLLSLESDLANLELNQITDQLYWREGTIIIPKFRTELELTNLVDILKKLGMIDIFSNNANFGSLLDSSEPLRLSQAIHKAIIEINEDGAEAAAATGGGMIMSSVIETRDQPFKADHPFLYYIMDPRTNTVIFSGRYKHPSLQPSTKENIKNDEL